MNELGNPGARKDMNMEPKMMNPRLSRTNRHRLTARGYSIESAYRTHIDMQDGRAAREAYEEARVRWGTAHGLDPDYGAYLVELQEHERTLPQLEEDLAICGQSVSMVRKALRTMMQRDLIEAISPGVSPHQAPSREMASAEVAAATMALDTCRSLRAHAKSLPDDDSRDSLAQALSRTIAARNYLSSFPH